MSEDRLFLLLEACLNALEPFNEIERALKDYIKTELETPKIKKTVPDCGKCEHFHKGEDYRACWRQEKELIIDKFERCPWPSQFKEVDGPAI